MRIGLVGCGSIGRFLLEKINREKVLKNTEIVAVFDERSKSIKKIEKLASQFEFDFYRELDDFAKAPLDLIVECANIQAVKDYALTIVKEKDLLVISIGALADESFLDELVKASKTGHRKVYLPTGAIGGLDLIKAANSLGGLEQVSLVSRKPANALENSNLTTEKTLFEGRAKEAIEKFPENANVAIAISLAGIGIKETTVQIIADPFIKQNIHTIHLEGEFGKAELSIQNNPSPDNPNTSYLTALSILSAIQSIDDQIVIG